jgi:hypothetical protein
MLKINKFFETAVFIIILTLIIGCSEKSTTEPDNSQYLASQADLNKSTNAYLLNLTGRTFGESSVPHNGTTLSPDSTYRDIFGTNPNKDDAIKKGTIITKRVFIRNADSTKGSLQVTFAMIKRESGYDTPNKDWEYVMMPFDASNNYNTNPNGILPDISNTQKRGKIAMCIGCHASASGGDFLFFN